LARVVTRFADLPFSYEEIGATRRTLPAGYKHVRERTRVGTGEAVFDAAASALRDWRMHRAARLAVAAGSDVAQQGAVVLLGAHLGSLWVVLAPCRVVWCLDERRRKGFAYGTLPGHPERGEEACVVERYDDDAVWVTISAFSRHASLPARALPSVADLTQRVVTRRYALALRSLVEQQLRDNQ
jgi:uncharacterized protein (UPF0548 family)